MSEPKTSGSVSRRRFLQAGAAGAMALGLAGCAPAKDDAIEAASLAETGDSVKMSSIPAADEGEWLPTTCNMCFNQCGILGHVVDGTLVEIKGDERSPIGGGHICGKGAAGIMQLYDPYRVTKPMKRTNPEKGLGIDPQWEEITWDEAYDLIIEHLNDQRDKGLPIGMFALIASISSLLDGMFFMIANGNSVMNFKADICGAPTHCITNIMTGSGNACPDYANVKYLIQFGTQAGIATRHGTNTIAKTFAESRANGCKLVTVDPHMSASAEKADKWIPIRPGTDAAFALAMANLLVNEYGIYDSQYLIERTNAPSLVNVKTKRVIRAADTNKALYMDSDGKAKPYDECKDPQLEGEFEVDGVKVSTAFSLFKKHVSSYTPEFAEKVTTVPADTIRTITKEFGEAACIGETVEVDGLTIPYRPACVDMFSGIARHKHGFLSNWAILQLNLLIGATNSYGGYLGYYPQNKFGFYEGDQDHFWDLEIWEEDGLLNYVEMNKYPSPNSYYQFIRDTDCTPTDEGMMALQPLSMDPHFCYISQLNPDLYHTTPSEVAFILGANPLNNWCNHDYQSELLKSFDWIFGMDIYLNDSSYFCDLIIPEPCYLERRDALPLTYSNGRVPGLKDVPFVVSTRMPVVEARDGVPSGMDTFGALAEKAGVTPVYTQLLGALYHLNENYALDPNTQVTAEMVAEAAMRSIAGPDKGLDWFRENGSLSRERATEEVYIFAAGHEGRYPLYFDFLLEAKEKVESKVQELDIYWETDDYIPLPEWLPCLDHEVEEEGYEYYPIYWTNSINTDTWQTQNAWINEINEEDNTAYFMEINSATGAKLGLASGDKIRMSNREGDFVEGYVVLSECVHPECVASMGGHLNSRGEFQPIAKGKGHAVNHLVPFGDPKRMEYMGASVDQCVRCKIEKI